ncbi:MAG: hypothetical protein PHS45_04775 [Bacilli bacterium]|nr:hypothetical protein [Bacilli bacterium]
MKKILKYKGVVIFYLLIASITYGLTLRVESLENNRNEARNSSVVILLP